jgi:hypothetical protein
VYAAALLVQQAGVEQRSRAGGRKALVAALYARSHLQSDPLGALRAPPDDLDRFKELVDGALVDDRT